MSLKKSFVVLLLRLLLSLSLIETSFPLTLRSFYDSWIDPSVINDAYDPSTTR
jgi:hypothetical protein